MIVSTSLGSWPEARRRQCSVLLTKLLKTEVNLRRYKGMNYEDMHLRHLWFKAEKSARKTRKDNFKADKEAKAEADRLRAETAKYRAAKKAERKAKEEQEIEELAANPKAKAAVKKAARDAVETKAALPKDEQIRDLQDAIATAAAAKDRALQRKLEDQLDALQAQTDDEEARQ